MFNTFFTFFAMPFYSKLLSFLGIKRLIGLIAYAMYGSIFIGVFMYVAHGLMLTLIDDYKSLSFLKLVKTLLFGFLYGFLLFIIMIFGLFNFIIGKSYVTGYIKLSHFYVVDKHANPISALGIAQQKITQDEAYKIRFFDNFTMAHIYRQLEAFEG